LAAYPQKQTVPHFVGTIGITLVGRATSK
jgi:hypothetical protein